jgi:hypothetical protein
MPDDHQHKLMKAFDFTTDDLVNNRSGHLTMRQRHRLKREAHIGMAISGGCAMFFAAAVAIFLIEWAGGAIDSRILGMISIAVVTMLLVAYPGWRVFKTYTPDSWRVESVRGSISISPSGFQGYRSTYHEYILKIGDIKFLITRKHFDALPDSIGSHDITHIVYYESITGRLVSIEAVM